MTDPDIEYVRSCLHAGAVRSPCLEMGAGYGGGTCRELLSATGISYFATDVTKSAVVDYVIDFEADPDHVSEVVGHRTFGSVLCLNVLEHCFEPIKVLDNALSLLRAGGTCVVIVPTVWPLHDFPRDCYRMNPNFYEEYCARRSVRLVPDLFRYVGRGPVRDHRSADGAYRLPLVGTRFKRFWSRIIHRLFGTAGRGMFFPSHLAIGCVMEKP